MRRTPPAALALAVVALPGLSLAAGKAAPRRPAPQSPVTTPNARRYTPAEARLAVRLLADFYRLNLREVHVTYVRDGKAPAATVLRAVFGTMNTAGWPHTRWLAVNGKPVNPANAPADAFEIEAARAVRQGTEVFEREEKGVYRAVARVEFTGDCLKCHWGDKPSDYAGGIAFAVPLQR